MGYPDALVLISDGEQSGASSSGTTGLYVFSCTRTLPGCYQAPGRNFWFAWAACAPERAAATPLAHLVLLVAGACPVTLFWWLELLPLLQRLVG
jgi:hypothetical protein